jgi:hypothetical protein
MTVHEHGNEMLFNIPMNFSQITLISPLDFFKIVQNFKEKNISQVIKVI